MFQAIKAGENVEKEILRTAMGEVTSTGEEPSDERVIKVLKKLVKSNLETLRAAASEEQKVTLQREIETLEEFLPETLSPQAIVDLLAPVADAIRAAKADGPAIGLAMKHLKALHDEGEAAEAESADVRAAVQQLRQERSSSVRLERRKQHLPIRVEIAARLGARGRAASVPSGPL